MTETRPFLDASAPGSPGSVLPLAARRASNLSFRMRLGMIDDGVVIHVLPARADIEAVQCTLAAFTVQRRARILARQQSAKSDRRGVNTRGTSQVELYRAHVVGRLAFLLYLCILD